MADYQYLEIPAEFKVKMLEVVKDISGDIVDEYPSPAARGQLPFIPKGSITWIEERRMDEEVYLIEGNRYYANIPPEFFKIINKEDMPIGYDKKYEVGVWYKNPNWSSRKDFAKATRFSGDESSIFFKESINHGRFEMTTNDSMSWSTYGSLQVASYEEYAEFLPDGHPDKKKSSHGLVIGKWYRPKPQYLSGTQVAFKLSRIGDDTVYFNEAIRTDDRWYKYRDGNWCGPKHIEECPLDVIQEYLPEGHEDKIKSMRTPDGYYKCTSSIEPHNFVVGRIYHFKNSRFTHEGGFTYDPVSSVDDFFPRYFKFAKATEDDYKRQLPIPKTGQYIKAVIHSPNGGMVQKGEVGLIREIATNGTLSVDFPNHRDYTIYKEQFVSSRYELMPAGYKPLLSVGQFIEAIVDEPSDGNVKKGEIGEIKRVDSSSEEYVLDFPSQKTYYVTFKDMANGSKYKIYPIGSAKPKPKLDIRTGQWIKVLVDYPNGGRIRKGEIGVVTRYSSGSDTLTADFPSQQSYGCTTDFGTKYELMPVGWAPSRYDNFFGKKAALVVTQYVKALEDNPEYGDVKYGEYGVVTNVGDDTFLANFPSNPGFIGHLKYIGDKYEVMPVDFKPPVKVDKTLFKKGGWVRCIAPAKTNQYAPENQFKVGEYYQIESFQEDRVKTPEGYILMIESSWQYDIECEWYGMKPPAGYKSIYDTSGSLSSAPVKGQYIKALVRNPEFGDVDSGHVGEIISVHGDTVRVNFPRHANYQVHTHYIGSKYQLMPIGWKAEAQAVGGYPKRGGWVRCIAPAKTEKSASCNQFKVGSYYEVSYVGGNYVETPEGYKLNFVKTEDYDIECEFIGMTKPTAIGFTETAGLGELTGKKKTEAMDTYVEAVEDVWAELAPSKKTNRIK